MVDLFEMEDKCDKHFNEGKYAKKEVIKKETIKDEEEVVHIEEDVQEEEVIEELPENADNNKEE